MTASTTIILINLLEFTPNWIVSTNFDSVEASVEAREVANTTNIESFLIRVTIVLTILNGITMIAVGHVALILQKYYIGSVAPSVFTLRSYYV